MIQKERKKKKKQNSSMSLHTHLDSWKRKEKKLKCVIVDTLGFLETFLQKHRTGKSLGSAV